MYLERDTSCDLVCQEQSQRCTRNLCLPDTYLIIWMFFFGQARIPNTGLDDPLYHRYVVHQNTQLPNFQCILCCNEVTFPKCVPTPSCACPVSKQSQPLLFPHIIGDQISKLDLCHNRNKRFHPREIYHFHCYPPRALKS